MVTGLVRSQSGQPKEIASKMPLRTHDRSIEQRQRRFLVNEWIDIGQVYAPFVRLLMQACKEHMIPLILDGSVAGYLCQILMATVGYQYRVLPFA
jgi:hypothetical protein